MGRMTKRGVTGYGLLGLMAILVSTAVAWGCVLWAPMTTSRPLSEAEAAEIMVRQLDAKRFIATPGGIKNSGPGWMFVFAVDAMMPDPPQAQPRYAATDTNRGGGGNRGANAFTRVPGNPEDKYVQIVLAGWPASCYQGATTKVFGQSRTHHGLYEPPELLGVKPRRVVPLHPRWTGLAVDTIFYGAIFWLAIPGPKLLRRVLRRRRGQCPDCGYDLAHHEHATCPECGAGKGP